MYGLKRKELFSRGPMTCLILSRLELLYLFRYIYEPCTDTRVRPSSRAEHLT